MASAISNSTEDAFNGVQRVLYTRCTLFRIGVNVVLTRMGVFVDGALWRRGVVLAVSFVLLGSGMVWGGLKEGLQVGDTVYNQVNAAGRRDGIWVKKRPNGTLVYRAEYRDGQPVGRTYRYGPDGRVESLIEYRDAHVAHVTHYDRRGQKQGEGLYYDREKDSTWVYWSGELKVSVENWRRGVKDGVFETYSNSGKLAERQRWKAGKLQGKQESYYATGALRMVQMMDSDVPVGKCYTYFSNGLIRLEGQYKDGQRDGKWTIYDIDGKVESVTEYRAGQEVGGDGGASVSRAIDDLLKNKGKIPEPSMEQPY